MIGDLRRYAAANARVRTLLPTLLGHSGLEALYGYPTRKAMLDVLSRTPYGPGLLAEPRSEDGLHARLVHVAQALLALLTDPEQALLRHYLLRHEVDNLKLAIRAVHRHLAWEQIAAHVVPLLGMERVNMQALAGARDLRDLADRLAPTPYAAVVLGALHRVEAAGSFAVEVALDLDYYDRLWAATESLESSDRRRAQRLLGMLCDILNLGWIARYRDALGLTPEEILNYTLRQGCWVTFEIRRALAESPAGTWDAALARTPYAAVLADRGFEAASAALWHLLAAEIQRTLRSYPFHIGVPLGFLLLQDIEIRDLQILLAAKHMGLPPDEAFGHVASGRN